MKKGNLTREQAIEKVGAVEFSTDINFVDKDGRRRTLTAHYYQDPEDDVIGDVIILEWAKN